jgi:hypothetical protein
MNCEECRDNLARLVGEPSGGVDIRRHLAECDACRQEAEATLALHARLERAAQAGAVRSREFVDSVLSEVEQRETVRMRRLVMWKRVNWSLGAAAAVLALAFWLVLGTGTTAVRAAEVLQAGAKAAKAAPNLHISGRIRSGPAENPGSIDLELPFVTLEIWKRVTDKGVLQWRIEKPQRVIVMDGSGTYTYVSVTQAAFKVRAMPDGGGDTAWLGGLLRVGDLLENEVANAGGSGYEAKVTTESRPDGHKASVVTIEAKAYRREGQESEWLKNKTIWTSDTKRVYRFDDATHQLLGVQIYVHVAGDKDVLIFETTAIEYPAQVDDKRFQIELPAGVAWQDMEKPIVAAEIPEACKPEKKPEEVARAFLEALSKGDQRSFESFWQVKLNFKPEFYAGFKGLKIVSIGEPEKGLSDRMWFVPYKIELVGGEAKEFKLNVRCDNPARRWYVDGGL